LYYIQDGITQCMYMILCYELVYSFLSISIVMEFDVVKKIESIITIKYALGRSSLE